MEDNIVVDYRHAKIVLKYLNNKHFGDYHDLCVQSDILLLADVFEISRNRCLNVILLIFYQHLD